jgi:regulator of PEP synthase PpsR (kinase-PPPase family)
MMQRTVFLVSDQTGITVEALGHSLLSQFEGFDFVSVTVPFVDTVDKARQLAVHVDAKAAEEGVRPIVFTSLVQDAVRAELMQSSGLVLDFFEAFLAPLESELGAKSLHEFGRGHGKSGDSNYDIRIEATDYAIATDDGHGVRHYQQADLILVGVSRSGKTPTCLYLALQYGIFAGNYPLAGDELEGSHLPKNLVPYREKLYGLTISPERLRQIRLERRARGTYASPQQVSFELRAAEAVFKRFGIPYLDTTHSSIEEIAAKILSQTGLERRVRV